MQQLDNFQIEKLLGEGSFGQVYLTTRKGDSKKYATKKLDRKTKYYIKVRAYKSTYYGKYSDAKKVTFKDNTTVKKSSGTTKSTSDADVIVYVTKTGSKYHNKKCGNGTYTESTLEAAKKRGLEPCSKCYKG